MNSEIKKRSKELCKDRKGEENEVWAKENKINDGKDMKRERKEIAEKNMKTGTGQETATYQYLGITIN